MAFTYFYRDWQTLEAAAEAIVPELTRHRFMHIWDAGCANGPEPYTLAMILRQQMGHFMFRNLRIHATDIDESNQFGPMIAEGVFAAQDLQRIPRPVFERFFKPADRSGYCIIDQELRNVVRYTRHDILGLEPIRTGLHLIVCKNVLLHFTPEDREKVLRMYHQALAPDGFLVVEQTQKLPEPVQSLFEQVCPSAQVFRKLPLPSADPLDRHERALAGAPAYSHAFKE